MKFERIVLSLLFLIAAAASGYAQTHVFARGTDGTLIHYDGARWQSLGGQIVGSPDACSWGRNRIDVVVRGTNNHLYQAARVNGEWAWYDLGGSLTSSPTCVSWGPNRIDVFARGADTSLVHLAFDGAGWSDWESLGGELAEGSGPDAASWGPNRIDVFIRGTDNKLWQKAWTGTQWDDWVDHGGRLTSDPGAVSWGHNRISIFARRLDSQMMRKGWDGTNWSDWAPYGGRFNEGSGPDAVAAGPNQVELYARGMEGALWRRSWDGSRWTSWTKLGGEITSDPGAVIIPADRGRFRVVLNGFTVNRETWDEMHERDGKRDEVFFIATAHVFRPKQSFDRRPEVVSESGVLQSRVMGDINRSDWRTTRVQAGKASDLGGVQTGDNFPGNAPWARSSEPQGDRLPMLLWEGDLFEGGNTVVVIPTIWEWDGDPHFQPHISRLFSTLALDLIDPVLTVLPGEDRAGGSTTFRNVISTLSALNCYDSARLIAENMVVGIHLNRSAIGNPRDRPIGMYLIDRGDLCFRPLSLRLNYAYALEIAGTNFGRGVGVVMLRYRDAEELKGDYTLYVQVERLPD